MPGHGLPATGEPYIESLESRRGDVGVTSQFLLAGRYVAGLRGSYSTQHHRHLFGDDLERDAYRPEDVPIYRYTYWNPGIFAQDDIQAATWLSFSVSARADFHSQYGTLFSPRLAILMRGHGWTSRLSLGQGFSAPSALTEETEAAGSKCLVVPYRLKVERGRGFTFDLTRSWRTFTATTTLFASHVHHPLYVDQTTAYTDSPRCSHEEPWR